MADLFFIFCTLPTKILKVIANFLSLKVLEGKVADSLIRFFMFGDMISPLSFSRKDSSFICTQALSDHLRRSYRIVQHST